MKINTLKFGQLQRIIDKDGKSSVDKINDIICNITKPKSIVKITKS